MSKVYKKLTQIFQFPKNANLETANRKTLDLFVEKSDLQARRQAHWEANCPRGKHKSKVTLCKRKNRPAYDTQLNTLSTKALREYIGDFLKDIGFFQGENKSEKELRRLEKKHKWRSVVFLSNQGFSDSEKEDEKEAGTSFLEDLPPEKRKSVQVKLEQVDAEHERTHARSLRKQAKRRRATSVHPRVSEPLQVSSRKAAEKQKHKYATVITGRNPDGTLRRTKRKIDKHGAYKQPEGTQVDVPLIGIDEEQISSIPAKKPQQKLKQAVAIRKKLSDPVITETQTLTSQPEKTTEKDPKRPDFPDEEPEPVSVKQCSKTPAEPNSCMACEPVKITDIKLTRKQEKEYQRLNGIRKLVCAKLELLKCTLDCVTYQRKCWLASQQNTHGDYYSTAQPKDLSKLKGGYTDPLVREALKSVLANQSDTHRLKNGNEQLRQRLRGDRKKLGSQYTLPFYSHDQLEDQFAWSNDKYTKRALENRPQKDRPADGETRCEQAVEPKSDCECDKDPQKSDQSSPKKPLNESKSSSPKKPLINRSSSQKKPLSRSQKIPPPIKIPEPAVSEEPTIGLSKPLAEILPPESPRISPERPLLIDGGDDAFRRDRSRSRSPPPVPPAAPAPVRSGDSPPAPPPMEPPTPVAKKRFSDTIARLTSTGEGFGDIPIMDKPEPQPPEKAITKDVIPTVVEAKPIEHFEDKPKSPSTSQQQIGLEQARADMTQQLQKYKERFQTPLDIFITSEDYLRRLHNEVGGFWTQIEQNKQINSDLAESFYTLIHPIVKLIPWVDTDRPIEADRQISAEQLEIARPSFQLLQTTPDLLTGSNVIHILELLAPQKIDLKIQEKLDNEKQIQNTNQLIEKKTSELTDKKASGLTAKPKKGIKSRVSGLFKKPKKKKKPKRKRRKKKVQPIITKTEEPLQKIIEPDVPSPRITEPKITKKQGLPRDYVKRKYFKRYH